MCCNEVKYVILKKLILIVILFFDKNYSGSKLIWFRAAVLNLGYAYPWGYVSSLQGVRQISNQHKISQLWP